MTQRQDILDHWVRAFDRVEQTILVSLLLIMVGVAFIQILLRIFFSSGIIWGDVALRHLVLWVGLLGAILATRESRHISIDALPRLLSGKAKDVLGIFIDLFSALICAFLARAGFIFVMDEFLSETTTFLAIPGWIIAIIFPVAFAIVAMHFGLNGLSKIFRFGKPSP